MGGSLTGTQISIYANSVDIPLGGHVAATEIGTILGPGPGLNSSVFFGGGAHGGIRFPPPPPLPLISFPFLSLPSINKRGKKRGGENAGRPRRSAWPG